MVSLLSPKKQMKTSWHSRKSNGFIRFLAELKTPKRHFKINWPLVTCQSKTGRFCQTFVSILENMNFTSWHYKGYDSNAISVRLRPLPFIVQALPLQPPTVCNCSYWTGFFLVVLRPVSHSPLENAPFLLGTKTDLLWSAIQRAQQHGSRDHKSFVALLYRSGAITYNVCK